MTKKARLRKAISGRKFTAAIAGLAGVISFVGQLTSKDRGAYAGKTKMAQLQTLANNLGGRLFGWQPFGPNSNPSFRQAINTDNLWNPYVQTGVALVGVNVAIGILNKLLGGLPIGKTRRIRIPMGAKLATIGGSMIGGGLLGALFDAPDNGRNFSSVTSNSGYNSQYVTARPNFGA